MDEKKYAPHAVGFHAAAVCTPPLLLTLSRGVDGFMKPIMVVFFFVEKKLILYLV